MHNFLKKLQSDCFDFDLKRGEVFFMVMLVGGKIGEEVDFDSPFSSLARVTEHRHV